MMGHESPEYCEICADEKATVARLVDVHNNLWEYYCEKCDALKEVDHEDRH